MSEESTDFTGYPEEEAVIYDQKRFKYPAGKAFDKFEKNQLYKLFSELEAGEKILEVGCGTGRFMADGREFGLDMTGGDMSAHMINEARQKLDREASLCVLDGTELPIQDNMFDGVYSIRTLNQLPTQDHARSMIHEMIRVCKPGGEILVEFVNSEALFNRYRENTTYLTKEDVTSIFENKDVTVNWTSGILFFTQTVLEAVPSFGLPAFARIDEAFAKKFPRRATRCYIGGTVQ
ncbi:class I SAM-dependent methyltransferase [Natrinema halophilum]|uniref:Class I SAM-dependent methyltransferase n=1 Tax=Natrinema halophilum TaxID=1699371 RepID=A0A7D5KSF2_9EURY|nr:class I SAM-dependent methyltransferase [Natrinema halophilum]QLG50237.1 class I SAM-dependent methyltransferase [Natrinema halophilum]